MTDYTIYHNPRCTKSRKSLALLEEKGITPKIVLYLQDTPSPQELKTLLKKLGISARDLLRKSEDAYKEHALDKPELSDAVLIDAMHAHPKLIERPIIVHKDHAVIGRPPENILALL